jgi:hypothetical protein
MNIRLRTKYLIIINKFEYKIIKYNRETNNNKISVAMPFEEIGVSSSATNKPARPGYK